MIEIKKLKKLAVCLWMKNEVPAAINSRAKCTYAMLVDDLRWFLTYHIAIACSQGGQHQQLHASWQSQCCQPCCWCWGMRVGVATIGTCQPHCAQLQVIPRYKLRISDFSCWTRYQISSYQDNRICPVNISVRYTADSIKLTHYF